MSTAAIATATNFMRVQMELDALAYQLTTTTTKLHETRALKLKHELAATEKELAAPNGAWFWRPRRWMPPSIRNPLQSPLQSNLYVN